MEECIFCKIINKDIPASVIYEDERMIAFDDINPQVLSKLVKLLKKRELPEEDTG
jgi:histidine triad (HIT) family protein